MWNLPSKPNQTKPYPFVYPLSLFLFLWWAKNTRFFLFWIKGGFFYHFSSFSVCVCALKKCRFIRLNSSTGLLNRQVIHKYWTDWRQFIFSVLWIWIWMWICNALLIFCGLFASFANTCIMWMCYESSNHGKNCFNILRKIFNPKCINFEWFKCKGTNFIWHERNCRKSKRNKLILGWNEKKK